jgi:diguanylate cyclase (GGDEF)-like protein
LHPIGRSALPRVLVADDEPANILIIKHALQGECEVITAGTGTDVLERVIVDEIDLILLDVIMPGPDGFEICRVLKSSPLTAGIPIIFVTALDERADETRGFDAGAVDYIAKPIHPSVVRARVRTHLELKRSRDLLEQLASVDPLTGVANRRRFDYALEEEWRRARRTGRWLSLALVDVDHFKQFNDRYGHVAGDDRLRAIAGSLASSARRAGDLVARYGGEEFGLILPEVEPAMMLGVMRTLLNGASAARGEQVMRTADEVVTVSVGAISVIPQRDSVMIDALNAADVLLYDAKDSGRDRGAHKDLTSGRRTTISRSASEARS